MQSCLPELFCILRYCNLDCTEMDSLIQWGLTTGDPAVLRHCLGMILSLSEKSPERAAALLKRRGYTNVTDIGGIADYRGRVVR